MNKPAATRTVTVTRKQPRDFVHVDEFWAADNHWDDYFISNQVWVYLDEYRAEVPGDEDYCRIIINGGNERGWIYQRPLSKRTQVLGLLREIEKPVSEAQLSSLGFTQWSSVSVY